MYYPGIFLGGRRKDNEKPQSAQVVSRQRFEPYTSRYYPGILLEGRRKDHEKLPSAQVVFRQRFEPNTSKYYPGIILEGRKKTMKTHCTGGVPTKIRTEYLEILSRNFP
jgi:hypothetical protein